jgi:hypothetical protein
MKKLISMSLITAVLFNLTACGTILHPERKGQTGGRIDPAVAILDGIGLLFFVIPGAIAFAVDFGNGTIYLPDSKRSSLDIDDMQAIKVDNKILTKEMAAQIVAEKTGKNVDVTKAEIYKEDHNGVKRRFF